MKEPLVTVYITNYNYGKYIRQAIESVLSQTFQDFELIIIDDGSTDNSKDIIEEYANNPKIKIIYQQNKGLNVTNNIALKVAKGKYIMRLDADDFLHPEALEKMVTALEKDNELGLVFPDYYIVDAEGNIINEFKRHSFDKEVSLLDMPAHGACTMIRKSFLKRLGGYDEQYRCQDGYELWIKFINRYKVNNINEPLFYYRRHGNNLTTNEDKILETRKRIKENYLKKTNQQPLTGVAIIPVRGSKYDNKNIALLKLGGKTILDRKIESALKSKRIKQIIISSPDEEIEAYVTTHYSGYSDVVFHKRKEALARLNTGLTGTINDIINKNLFDIDKTDVLVVLSPEYPFVTASSIDDAINTLQIFNSDVVISVREENQMFFQHDGNGMKPILNQDKFTKLERESLYKYTGGILATRKSVFIKEQKLLTGKVSHIVIDQKSSLGLHTKLDIEIAKCIVKHEN